VPPERTGGQLLHPTMMQRTGKCSKQELEAHLSRTRGQFKTTIMD
jgi:hypothetical protein